MGLRSGSGPEVQVFPVFLHVGADGFAPTAGAEGVDVFVLGEVDGLAQDLAEVSESGGGPRFDVTLNGRRNEWTYGFSLGFGFEI